MKPPSRPQSALSERDRFYAAALLFVAQIFDYADRQVVSVLLPAFKRSLDLSLVQASLIQGFAFSLFFALAGLPLGRAADRMNRRNLMAIGIVMWSLATVACGLSHSFWQLFLARMSVGVGEATLMPATASLLADYYAANQRGRAINFVQSGASIGTIVATLGGGWLLTWFDRSGVLARLGLPLENWQAVFLTLGGPGLVLAALLMGIKEPPRREDAPQADQTERGFLDTFRKHPAAFIGLFGLQTFVTMEAYAILSWTPTILMTSYGQSPGAAGAIMGLMVTVSGFGAYLLSGVSADLLIRWRPRNGRVWLPGAILPFGIAALVWLDHSRGLAGATLALGLALFTGAAIAACGNPALQAIVPGKQRGVAIALSGMINTLVGLGIAPTIVAARAQMTGTMERGLQHSLAVVCVATMAAAMLLWPFLIRAYARSRNYELEEREQPLAAHGARATGPRDTQTSAKKAPLAPS